MKSFKPKKKIFGIILNVIAWLSFFVAVILSLAVLFSTFSGTENGKTVFGHKLLIVKSDSMIRTEENKDEKIFFSSGDLILVKEVKDYTDIEVGDVITFVSYNPGSVGKTLSHKVRSIKTNANGDLIGYETYGIKTGVSDLAVVEPSTIIGKYVGKAPRMGTLFMFFKTPAGFFTSILIPCLLLIIFFSIRVGKLIGKKEMFDNFNGEIKTLNDRMSRIEKEGVTMKTTEVIEQSNADQNLPAPTECSQVPQVESTLELTFKALNTTIESLTRTIESLAATAEKPVETLARTVEALSIAATKPAAPEPKKEEIVEEPACEEAEAAEVEEVIEPAVVEEVVAPEEPEINEDLPFSEKLFLLDIEARTYFSDVHNELVSYQNVKYRISHKGIAYRVFRNTVANIAIEQNTVKLYISVNQGDREGDKSLRTRRYNDVLFTISLTSNRSKNKALKLIDQLAQSNELVKNDDVARENIFRQLKFFR